MQLRPVPRVSASSFRPPRFGGAPVIVDDVARAWRATSTWGPEHLKTLVGDRVVDVHRMPKGPRSVYDRAKYVQMPFPEYVDWVLKVAADLQGLVPADPSQLPEMHRAIDERLDESYFLDVRMRRLSERLFEDFQAPPWFAVKPVATLLWLGVLGTSSGLHFDAYPNCNVQLAGRKLFLLFPPRESARLYPRPEGLSRCQFDPILPDYGRFPRARDARGWSAILEPGQSLYLPAGWYHHVTTLSAWALNVNFWWPRPRLHGLAIPLLWKVQLRAALRRLRAKARPPARRGPGAPGPRGPGPRGTVA
jgi:hypothetical protein